MRLFASVIISGTAVVLLTGGGQSQPTKFDRTTLSVPASQKSGKRSGLVTRESIAIAACRAAAARYGKLVGNDLRLLDRHTFLISGMIATELSRREARQRRFSCVVTDQGQVLEQGFGDLRARSMRPRPRPDGL